MIKFKRAYDGMRKVKKRLIPKIFINISSRKLPIDQSDVMSLFSLGEYYVELSFMQNMESLFEEDIISADMAAIISPNTISIVKKSNFKHTTNTLNMLKSLAIIQRPRYAPFSNRTGKTP